MSQLSLFAPRSDLNGVAPAVTAPVMPGHSVGLPHVDCKGRALQVGDRVLDICNEASCVVKLEENRRVRLSSGWVPFASTLALCEV